MLQIDFKIFNDSVHGHIEVHPLLVKIIDTPQFQRLRNIKQLGAGYFVYPGAAHNRFEHSIGTSHLAEKLVKSLQERQPELGITDKDVLCVTIAGLCHDLGHGPFSHLFDNLFIKEVAPEKKWTHEDASVEMFKHLVESNGLKSEFENYGLHDEDRVFIQKLIKGLDANTENDDTDDGTRRPKEKNFLYEIVANKLTGIDVDKFDYFARDCHNLGIKNSFDHNRYIKMTRVLKVKEGEEERFQICVRDKEAANIYGMFYTRYRLHQQAYQHKTTNIIEIMICEALKKANPHLLTQYKIQDENGPPKLIAKKMSEAIDDMEAYMKLTDNVYYQILYSTEDNLEEARKLIEDIEKRKIYQCIGQTILVGQHSEDNDVILNQMLPGMDHDLFIVDVRHGPFSHLFDNLFIKEVAPEKKWTHEDASVEMFKHLVESNGLKSEFENYGLHDEDRVFIQKLIKGLDANTENDDTDDGTRRPKEKNFLYEIVANKLTGIDVDKFDYFARDCHNLGIKNSFDHNRYIKMTRVLKVKEGEEERFQICVRDKEAANIYGMFYTRYRLHQQAYQHKTTNIIEIMICEALKKANPHLLTQYKIQDENGPPKLIAKKMSEAIDDMEAYMKLTDNVYYQILYSTEDNLEEARKLIEDIEKRKIYQCIGQTILVGQHSEDNDVILNQMLPGMDHDLFIVDRVKFDYGKKKHYDNLRFYMKEKQTTPEYISKDKVSQFLPESFEEKQIRVYCKSDDKKIKDEAKQAFDEWCDKSNDAGHPQQ